jgi:hypothetical protein
MNRQTLKLVVAAFAAAVGVYICRYGRKVISNLSGENVRLETASDFRY